MSEEVHLNPPTKSRLLLLTLLAATFAALIFVVVILPAEFHRDPTGFGRATGLDRLAGPTVVTVPVSTKPGTGGAARYYESAFRSDFVDIPLAPAEDSDGSELEYKVKMKAGDSFVYSWIVAGMSDPAEFYSDFHGESPPQPEVKVVEYLQRTGTSSNGVLIAPMEGVHGWYLQNQSSKAVVVRLKLSGFYELVTPGSHGNEGGIVANKHVEH